MAIYYVSTTGNDSNPGTLASPWRTFQKAANTAAAGDIVNLRGGTYGETVEINVSGSAGGGFITFQSYAGETAKIDGTTLTVGSPAQDMIFMEDRSYIRLQRLEICNFRTSSPGAEPQGIMIQGTSHHIEILNNKIHHIETNATSSSNGHGILVIGSNGSTAITDLVIDGNELYSLRTGFSECLTVNGNINGFRITNNIIHDCNNIGIDMAGHYGAGPTPATDQARNGICSGNLVYNIDSFYNPAYGGSFTTGGGSRGADGIYVDGGTDIVIERNIVKRCNIGIEMASEHSGKSTSFITVRNNVVIESHNFGIAIGGYDTGRGSTTNCKILNNTLYKNGTLGDGSDIEVQFDTRDNVIKNNVTYGNGLGYFIHNGYTQNTGNVVDYNLYYAASGPGSAQFMWKNVNYSSWAAYQQTTTGVRSGNDSHGLWADPLFANLTTQDLHVLSSSPAVGRGDNTAVVGGELDLDGQARIQGGTVDMGAYEISSGAVSSSLAVGESVAISESVASFTSSTGRVALSEVVALAEASVTSASTPSGTADEVTLSETVSLSEGLATEFASAPLTGNHILRCDIHGLSRAVWAAADVADGIYVASYNEHPQVSKSTDGRNYVATGGIPFYPVAPFVSTRTVVRCIHGTPGAEQVWISGGRGLLAKSSDQGASWTKVLHPISVNSTVAISAIWVKQDGSKVYAACEAANGQIYSTTNGGSSWTLEADLSGFTPKCFAGISDGTVWCGGETNKIYKSAGTGSWAAETVPAGSLTAWGMVAVSASEVYARLANASDSDSGGLLKFNGTSWAAVSIGITPLHLQSLWAVSGHLYVGLYDPTVVRNKILHSTNGGTGFTSEFSALRRNSHAVSRRVRHLVGVGGVAYAFASWSVFSSAEDPAFETSWGGLDMPVFATTIGAVGGSWVTHTGRFSVRGIWGTGESALWAVGDYGAVWKWTGSGWLSKALPIPSSGFITDVQAVWGSSINDLYVADGYVDQDDEDFDAPALSRILHTTDGGASWTEEFSSFTTRLNSLWGSGSTDVWAVGGLQKYRDYTGEDYAFTGSGVVLHSVGTGTWTTVTLPSPGSGVNPTVTGTSASDVWILGTDPVLSSGIHHGSFADGFTFEGHTGLGTKWEDFPQITGGASVATGDVLVTTKLGTIRGKLSTGLWAQEFSFPLRNTELGAVAVATNEIYIRGQERSNGFLKFSSGDRKWRSVALDDCDLRAMSTLVAIGGTKFIGLGVGRRGVGVYRFTGTPVPLPAEVESPTHSTPVGRRRWEAAATPLNEISQGGVLALVGSGLHAGHVMWAGGDNANQDNQTNTVQFFDPVANTWTAGPSMSVARGASGGKAIVLSDGRIMVVGGDYDRSSVVDIYSPTTNSWSTGASIPFVADYVVPAVLTASGKVLLMSSREGGGGLYDPLTDTWALVPNVSLEFDTESWRMCIMPAGPHVGKPFLVGDQHLSVVFNENTMSWTPVASHRMAESSSLADCWLAVVGGKVVHGSARRSGYSQTYDPLHDVWYDNGWQRTLGGSDAFALDEGVLFVPFSEHKGTYGRYYDPAANAWFLMPEIPSADEVMGEIPEVYKLPNANVAYCAAIKLSDGDVLVAGNWLYNNSGDVAYFGCWILTTEVEPTTARWFARSDMWVERSFEPGNGPIKLSDGSVLVVGGQSSSLQTDDNPPTFGQGTFCIERLHPTRKLWSIEAFLELDREGHQVTRLQDDRVLISGGWSNAPIPTLTDSYQSSCEIFNPGSSSCERAGSMSQARWGHRAVLIEAGAYAGKLLVTGGRTSDSTCTATCEFYDADADVWNATGSMVQAREGHALIALPDGRAVAIGGAQAGAVPVIYDPRNEEADYSNWADEAVIGLDAATKIEVFEPGTGVWAEVATMSTARFRPRATLLSNGKIFIYQGLEGESPELFDPATNTVSVVAASPLGVRECHGQTALPSGKLLISGGADYAFSESFGPTYRYWTRFSRSSYFFDPVTEAFVEAPELYGARTCHGTVVLNSGTVLAVGGHLTVVTAMSDSHLSSATASIEELMFPFAALAEAVPWNEVLSVSFFSMPVGPVDIPYHGPRADHYDPLGVGMIRPFYRATHGDFISHQGVPVVMSNIGQILGTRIGTLPWRPELGSSLETLRHLPNSPALRELAKVYVQTALGKWEPRAGLNSVAVLAPRSMDESNQVQLRGRIAIAGAGEQRLDLKFGKSLTPQTPADALAWGLNRLSRIPRGMGAVAEESEPVRPPRQQFITGLIRPFFRGADLRFGTDIATLNSNVGQVLGTRKGTLPWRPEFGAGLHRLRHLPNSDIVRELARADTEQALTKWEPRARVVAVEIVDPKTVGLSTLAIRARYRAINLHPAEVQSVELISR